LSGIYLHIPFCKQACSYCDFYFVTRTGEKEAFVERLVDEIKSYASTPYLQETVETIYIGGGTPSLLSADQLGYIFQALSETFDLQTREVTLEMNPDDVSRTYLQELREMGINRASMGVQSFNPELLEFMHRAHSREEAIASLEMLSDSGFETFTVDLIYGNPGQSLEVLQKDIKKLLQYNPMHISAYALTIESGTRLGKQVELGRIAPPEDDQVADHFFLLNRLLKESGIYRYEVSNFSKTGHEAVHNSNYWRHENYLGFGPGAHSFWWEGKGAAARWENRADLKHYMANTQDTPADEEVEKLELPQLAEERIMMGLRTRVGISLDELGGRYDYILSDSQLSYLKRKQAEGKLTFDDSIVLTDRGIVIADAIILDLITLK
jgi:oxygen-independent coproporphyrinogen-3 oxidase